MNKTSIEVHSFQELGPLWTVRTHVRGGDKMIERENGVVAEEEEATEETAEEVTDGGSEEE